MARRVFFSFHYQDVIDFRANVVRNAWVTLNKQNKETFYDNSIWEEAKKKGKNKLKELINDGLKGSSVTVALIGTETYNRQWVKYELFNSFIKGNGIFEVYINRIKSRSTKKISARGKSILSNLAIEVSGDGKTLYFKELVNGKWQLYNLLSSASNRKKNTYYFKPGYVRWFSSVESEWGKTYKLSDLFPSYCWVNDDGYNNFSEWVECAAQKANR